LIQLVLDGEASKEQDLYLKRHFKICPDCLGKLKLDKEVKKAIRLKLANKNVPSALVDSIKLKIAKSA
jgi:anti-sigma factor (TIGR02949 family)